MLRPSYHRGGRFRKGQQAYSVMHIQALTKSPAGVSVLWHIAPDRVLRPTSENRLGGQDDAPISDMIPIKLSATPWTRGFLISTVLSDRFSAQFTGSAPYNSVTDAEDAIRAVFQIKNKVQCKSFEEDKRWKSSRRKRSNGRLFVKRRKRIFKRNSAPKVWIL